MIQNKVLVRAGRFQGGKLPYVNYVGQIKPADMSKIIWWGDFGNDGTGDGSITAPFLTFPAALAAFSTSTHKWILKTDLSVYGEATAGQYVDDAADRVYLDPTKANDSGDGLTAATAKKTYAAAKAVLISSGRTAIHGVGSFTLTDPINARTQGEIGETLTFNGVSDIDFSSVFADSHVEYVAGARSIVTGTIIIIGSTQIGHTLGSGHASIKRSTDNGLTWTNITSPWDTAVKIPTGLAYGNGLFVSVGQLSDNNCLVSADDGLTWTANAIVGGGFHNFKGIGWSGTNFVTCFDDNFNATKIYTSPDSVTWTARTVAVVSGSQIHGIAADLNGGVMIVGRKTATAAYMIYSADHGVTWTDYSSVTGLGVGANTGGSICIGVSYINSYWYIFQDTLTPAVYFSNTPTTSWTNTADVFDMPSVTAPGISLGFSVIHNAFIFLPSTSISSGVNLISQAGVSVLSANYSGGYNNWFTMRVESSAADETFLVSTSDNSKNATLYRMTVAKTNIKSDVTNIKMDVSKTAKIAANSNVINFTAAPTTGDAAVSLTGCTFLQSYLKSTDGKALNQSGNLFTAHRNVIKGAVPALIKATAAAVGGVKILQNIFSGGLTLDNAGGTDKEVIQDNLIEGNFAATALVTVKSNITGSVVNSTSQSIVSTIPAIFVNTTDYFLSRIALGQAVDSPLINRSAYFSYTYNAVTYKDDFGPYRAFTALVQTVFREAFLLPRFGGNALSEDVENVAALLKSIRGKPDVSNRPQGRLDYLSWQSKSINSEVRRFVSYMEKLTDLTVYLDYDFNGQAPGAITINGAHSAGTFEINIQPLDIPVGTVVSLFGRSQIVTQRYPRAGAATKLVLDDVLGGGLSDAQSVEITYIQGAGEFVYVPNRPRKNLRIFSRKKDAYSGMVYTFVRKAE